MVVVGKEGVAVVSVELGSFFLERFSLGRRRRISRAKRILEGWGCGCGEGVSDCFGRAVCTEDDVGCM